MEDPLAAEEFGGNMFELQAAHQYQSALSELRKARTPLAGPPDQEADAGAQGLQQPPRGPKARAKPKGKGGSAAGEE